MRYPALIVTPMFSFWTFGTTIKTDCGVCYCSVFKEDHKIMISTKLTWLNILVSFAGAAAFCWVLELNPRRRFIPFYIMLSSAILVFLIQTLDYCKRCCCSACITHCYPVIKLTALDPTNMEEPVDREEDNIDDQGNQENTLENIALRDVHISECDVLF